MMGHGFRSINGILLNLSTSTVQAREFLFILFPGPDRVLRSEPFTLDQYDMKSRISMFTRVYNLKN